MGNNGKDQDQPGLWDDVSPGRGSEKTARPDRMSTPQTQPVLPAQRPTRPMGYQELWDIDQVANYLGVPKQTIYGWRSEGKGPKGFRVGKHLRWHASTVIAWTLGLERDQ